MKKSSFSLAAAITWLIISTILLTLPGNDLPSEDWLDKIGFDKWVHIGMFSVLTWLWCLAIKTKTRQVFFLIGTLCLIYGAGMEFIQRYFIPNRSFDIGDIIADGAGAALGVFYSIRRYIKK